MDKIIESEKFDGEHAERTFAQKSVQFANRFRKNTKKNEEDLNIVKVQYGEAQEKFLCDLKNLDYDLKSMTARGRAVEATRQREAHKFGADCQSLKKRVSAYERYIK